MSVIRSLLPTLSLLSSAMSSPVTIQVEASASQLVRSYDQSPFTRHLQDADSDIEYWTDYAIYPKRCITRTSSGVTNDMIMYSMFSKSYNHCADSPIGTYVTSVPTFVNAYLEQAQENANDLGEEFNYPAISDYIGCTYKQIAGVDYYLQVGCDDTNPLLLAVNIYSDATCTTPSIIEGYDDANVQLDDFNIKFKKCTPCVIWMDKNDDQIDDMYYENKQTYAPLCSAAWEYKEECDNKCQLLGRESKVKEGWNRADKVLLSILSVFGLGMLLAIMKKRQSMSNKDALLEQAAISAAGLQQTHVLGIFALTILIILIFAMLGLKKITWALLLMLNVVLFGYLMKLTVDGSVKETIIGPDGKIMEKDDSDDEEDDEEEEVASPMSGATGTTAGTGEYENPNLPTIT